LRADARSTPAHAERIAENDERKARPWSGLAERRVPGDARSMIGLGRILPLLMLLGCGAPSSQGSPAVASRGAAWQRHRHPVSPPPSSIPLLVVYVNWYPANQPAPAAQLAHPISYYEDLLFGGNYPSAVAYFREISLGAFTWTRAGSYGVFNQTLPADGSGADTAKNLNRVVTLASTAGFDFAPFDGDKNGQVTPDELTLMMISNNGGRIAGANRGLDPSCQAAGSVEVCDDGGRGVVEIEDEVQFATLVHEMSHTLGTYDLYGRTGLDYRASLMGPTIESGGADLVHSWWLDPWHRNQLGWTDAQTREFDRQKLSVGSSGAADSLPRGGMAFLWDSSRGNDDYFILEYRDRTGYDRDAGDTGIAIWSAKEGGDRGLVYVPYDGVADQPGVVTFTPDGKHGGAIFLKPSDGPVRLEWIDGSASGIEVQATDGTGGYRIERID
jgi:M6 family metalloprotease-like protein